MKPLFFLSFALLPLGVLRAQSEVPPAPLVPVVPSSEKTAPAEGQVESFAPLAYFDANCARCHGPNGSFYGKEFGKGLKDDAALKQIVREMCEGPGNAPIDDAKLEILTDFHRALRDDVPFVTIVKQSKAGASGEASPDAKLTLENGGKSLAIQQKGNAWSVNWPADFDLKGAKIVAKRGEKSSEIAVK